MGMQRVPSSSTPDNPPTCNSSAALPTFDLLGVPLTGLVVYSSVIKCDDGNCDALPAFSAGLVVAAGLVASSIYGFVVRGRCEGAKQEYRTRSEPHPALPD